MNYFKRLIYKLFLIDIVFMNKKIALITGITGQDGSYLAEFLFKKKLSSSWNKEEIHLIIQVVLITFTKNLKLERIFYIMVI